MLELVRALAIAWKNLAAYPAGHPALAASLALANQRLQELLTSGGATLGVARDGLVCGQEKVTSSHARDLAHALYLREVALLRFEPGVTAPELEALLRSISLDAARSDAPPLAGQLAAAGVTHVQIEAVDFSQVRVTDDMTVEARSSATLWDDLLRAILAGHSLSAEGRRIVDSGEAATPRGLASILQEAMGVGKEAPAAGFARGAGERARLDDRVSQVVGKRFSGASAERMLAASQIAELMRALPEDIRGSLVAAALRVLASDESAGEVLKVLADSAAPDTVLQALRQIKEEVPLSSHALRLLHALSAVAPSLGTRQTEAPDPALLAELSVLFFEDDVDRYNPDDHKELLARAALDVPTAPDDVGDLGDRVMTLTDDAVADHMANASVEMLVTLGGREGTDVLLARLEGVFRDCVSRGRLEAAVVLAEDLKALGDGHALAPAVQGQVDATIGRLTTADSLRAILDALNRRGAHSASLAHRLLDALGGAAARGFLIALAEEADKSRRRRILELLVSLGPVIAGPAAELLGDTQWYVVRNMVMLLHRVGDRGALPAVRVCATHPDLRVRLEAIKYLLAYDPDVPPDLLARAIHDPDPKMAEAAVTLAGNYGIQEAVAPLLDILAGWDVLGRRRSIRVKALKALGELADPMALKHLDRFFRDWRLPVVALDERRTAYRSLLSYPAESRADLVERGMRSRDAEIRRICLGLRRAGAAEAPSRA